MKIKNEDNSLVQNLKRLLLTILSILVISKTTHNYIEIIKKTLQ